MAKRRKAQGSREPSIRQQVWNVPNILTYGRVAIVPFVVYYLYQCAPNASPDALDHASRMNSFIACMLFCAAAVTDFFDGWIARNWNQTSLVGRFLDPLADKILVMACLIMTVYLNRVPAWLVVLLIARELSISSLRAVASSEGLEVQTSRWGKWKTVFQMAGIVGVVTHYTYPTTWGFGTIQFNYNKMGMALLVLSMLFSIYSAGAYFYKFAEAAVEAEKT